MKTVAFIPARGGSTRTPKKNLKPINGLPLCIWAANNVHRVLPKEDIYIDTDCDEIIEQAKKYGFNYLKRPDDLATNATDGNTFMLWEAKQVEADIYIQHLPPMAFLKETTLKEGLAQVTSGAFDSALGVVSEHLYLWDDKGPLYDVKNIPNSFTLDKTRYEGMGIYIVKKEVLFGEKTRFGKKPFLMELDKYERIDIDYPEDLEFAQLIAGALAPTSEYLKGSRELLRCKTKDVKLLVLDVDGTLTDGGMYFDSSSNEFKKFDTKDGRGIIEWMKTGGEVALLSSGKNIDLVLNRAKVLGISRVHVGTNPKTETLSSWISELGLEKSQVAYIGDDINDLCVRELVGFFACPNDSVKKVKEVSDVVLTNDGGQGAVREFVDTYLMKE